MPDVCLDLPIKAPLERVFWGVSAPAGLDQWWTKRSSGEPKRGTRYELSFGPGDDWRAQVTRCSPNAEFELELTEAHPDWLATRVGFRLERKDDLTWLRFHHTGWPSPNEHYRISCNCWAMYLRILRRHVEHGESVPYEERLDV